MQPSTLFEKVWNNHIVKPATADTPAILYIDLHLIHEVTSPQAFALLRQRGLRVRRPERTIGTMDHATPTTAPTNGTFTFVDDQARAQVEALVANCEAFGIRLFPLGDARQGIVHVIGPEQGWTQPGMTIVCGDSHTSTHGALGALAFGIGTTEVGYVLATQTVPQRRAKTLSVHLNGRLQPGVGAKDIILALIAKIGIGGGTGHVIEYRGPAISSLSMDERMTVCNMSIEAGARAGMIAPDDTTFAYLAERPEAPKDAAWESAMGRWRKLYSDPGASFDQEIALDVSTLAPMVTWGTNPGMGMPITDALPVGGSASVDAALAYMGLEGGKPLLGHPIDVVFIGSCTNSRLTDLRQAARVFAGRSVHPGVRALVVPGSQAIKKQAEAEGLHEVFRRAGAEWREPGCSMCIAMNGDQVAPGQFAMSTSNRNFKGRQGPGSRTFLASPLSAAAAAVTGKVSDVRELLK